MIQWANFLHIYQPPTQTISILEKVVNESYRPLIQTLSAFKNARITLNINATLTEQLYKNGFVDVIEGIGQLAFNEQIELTSSAKYHPILPLLPADEIKRQIELNDRTNKEFFKEAYNPKGFFPPEMCYSKELANILSENIFKWVIVDEIAYNGKLGQVPKDKMFEIRNCLGLRVFFKERKVSAAISYGQCPTKNELIKLIGNMLVNNEYILTGTDGETYGHHWPNQLNLLREVFPDKEIRTLRISDLLNSHSVIETIEPKSSSWSVWEDELIEGMPYPQWFDSDNEIHRMLWDLVYIVIQRVHDLELKYNKEIKWQQARHLLDQSLHSCPWWWISCRPWWGTEMTKRQIELISQAMMILQEVESNPEIENKAETLKDLIFIRIEDWDTLGIAKQRNKRYLRNHPVVGTIKTLC